MAGNETGLLLKCVSLYRKFVNINETYHVLRRNIATTSLKLSCTNLYAVKSYDETNLKVFTLSLWKKISWGLTYFDEFIYNTNVDLVNDDVYSKFGLFLSNRS